MTGGQFANLEAELTTDPTARGYPGMDETQAAADLNEKRIAARRRVSPGELRDKLDELGLLLVLLLNAENPATPSAKLALTAIQSATSMQGTDWNMDGTTVKGLLDTLQAEGLIDVSQYAAIMALGDKTISRAEELGFGLVTPGDVIEARTGGYV